MPPSNPKFKPTKSAKDKDAPYLQEIVRKILDPDHTRVKEYEFEVWIREKKERE